MCFAHVTGFLKRTNVWIYASQVQSIWLQVSELPILNTSNNEVCSLK